MVWEDFEEDDKELLAACDGEARSQYYSALSRGFIIYFIALCVFLVILFAAAWYGFWKLGT